MPVLQLDILFQALKLFMFCRAKTARAKFQSTTSSTPSIQWLCVLLQ